MVLFRGELLMPYETMHVKTKNAWKREKDKSNQEDQQMVDEKLVDLGITRRSVGQISSEILLQCEWEHFHLECIVKRKIEIWSQ
jgi:uncharacterized protein YjiS (DUF1127 family)